MLLFYQQHWQCNGKGKNKNEKKNSVEKNKCFYSARDAGIHPQPKKPSCGIPSLQLTYIFTFTHPSSQAKKLHFSPPSPKLPNLLFSSSFSFVLISAKNKLMYSFIRITVFLCRLSLPCYEVVGVKVRGRARKRRKQEEKFRLLTE